MNISFPSFILDLYQGLFKIAFYDIMDQTFVLQKFLSLFKFKDYEVPFISEQM